MRFFAVLIAFLCLALPLQTAEAAPKFPTLSGRVVDDAHILSQQTRDDLDQKLAGLEAKTSRQLVVVTLSSLQGYEISDYGYQLGRTWGIGQAKLNNGVLFIIAPNEHKVRIEVGYGLEPVLTDALSEIIIQQAVLPRFRSGDFDGGAEAGAAALIQQLSLDPSAAEARAAAAEKQVQHRQGGGATPFSILIIILFVAIAFSRIFGGFGFWPLILLGGLGGGRRDYGGGGWSGGGGGGWSGGGGGSFGGGGASGSW